MAEYHERLLAEMKTIELTILVGKYAQDHYLWKEQKKLNRGGQKLSRLSAKVFSDCPSKSIEYSLAEEKSLVY